MKIKIENAFLKIAYFQRTHKSITDCMRLVTFVYLLFSINASKMDLTLACILRFPKHISNYLYMYTYKHTQTHIYVDVHVFKLFLKLCLQKNQFFFFLIMSLTNYKISSCRISIFFLLKYLILYAIKMFSF